MKILIMGLPGSGKTTLAAQLAKSLPAIHFNADIVRDTLNRDLGFSIEDRIEHARRMGCMCQMVKDNGHMAIADFVCPTAATRWAFKSDFTIWMDTIEKSRFTDTNALFEPNGDANLRITNFNYNIDYLTARIKDTWFGTSFFPAPNSIK